MGDPCFEEYPYEPKSIARASANLEDERGHGLKPRRAIGPSPKALCTIATTGSCRLHQHTSLGFPHDFLVLLGRAIKHAAAGPNLANMSMYHRYPESPYKIQADFPDTNT